MLGHGVEKSVKAGLIINTAAVRGRARAAIERLARERFEDLDVAPTGAAGDVLRFAGTAWRLGFTRLIVAGGDGTIHEAANGIVNTDVELAILPGGSGNDFVRTLGIPTDLEKAMAIAAGDAVRTIDAAEVRCVDRDGRPMRRVFVNIAEAGMGGRVVRLAQPLRKVVGRRAGYHAGLAAALITHRWHPIRLSIDGAERGAYLMTDLIVANGQYFGGGMRPMPEARPDDGVLDIALIKDMSRMSIALNSGALKGGLPRNHPRIERWEAREVKAESDELVPVEADGEVLGYLPATFRILPASLKVVCPPG